MLSSPALLRVVQVVLVVFYSVSAPVHVSALAVCTFPFGDGAQRAQSYVTLIAVGSSCGCIVGYTATAALDPQVLPPPDVWEHRLPCCVLRALRMMPRAVRWVPRPVCWVRCHTLTVPRTACSLPHGTHRPHSPAAPCDMPVASCFV